jgi:RNA polymerase sigma factor (sigma-70 family)
LEASALHQSSRTPFLAGISPYLRLQRDEKLIALARRGHHGAFEVLVRRYEGRLLGFCRGMLGSTEDAEDVLQEVFASAYKAMLADDRPINTRPWLYRIARNRCLNFMRAPRPAGQDTMDVFEGLGTNTAETVQNREELRLIVSDVHALPESQRTALLLREMDALSYGQIALAMDTTVPAVKSLLVRARMSLAEAGEARSLTCDEVRLELGRSAEGLVRLSAPVRRHVKGCTRCGSFRKELRRTSRALAAAYPIGPILLIKKLVLAKAGGGAVSGAAGSGGAVSTGGAVGRAGGALGGAVSAALAPMAAKGVVGLAAAALLTAGAVEVEQLRDRDRDRDRPTRDAAASLAHSPATERPAVEVETGSKATGAAIAHVKAAGHREPVVQSFSPPAEPRAARAPSRAREHRHDQPVALTVDDASDEAPPIPGGPVGFEGPEDPGAAAPGTKPGAGEATRESVSPDGPAAGETQNPPESGAGETPPPDAAVGGKTAEETDPAATANDGIIPSRAHRGRRARSARKAHARKARRDRRAAPASSAPAEPPPSTGTRRIDSSSPAVEAGAATPQGRRALKNLSK